MKLDKGTQVTVQLPGKKPYPAVVVRSGKAKAKVRKDSGAIRVVRLTELTVEARRCKVPGCKRPAKTGDYCKVCFHRLSAELPALVPDKEAFKASGLKWSVQNTHFQFDTEHNIHFYGWYRKTKMTKSDLVVHMIDVFAKRNDRDYTVGSLAYQVDPRENPKTLSRKIVEAGEKWYTLQMNESVVSLDRLQKIADHPRIHIKRMETLDRIILKFKEFRDMAIRCGGTRLFELRGDAEGEPTIHVTVNLTMQAMGLNGKVPSLYHGAVFDSAVASKREVDRKRSGIITNVPDKGNVQVLVNMLKQATDPVERRKIRATLRKMGHKGGSRA